MTKVELSCLKLSYIQRVHSVVGIMCVFFWSTFSHASHAYEVSYHIEISSLFSSLLHLCPCVFRTLDDGVYRIALSLAKRYSVPLWEVYMTHLEFLFTDSG